MVAVFDLKSNGLVPSRFESGYPHQSFKIPTEQEIQAAKFICFLDNPKHDMCWNEGYAKAWLIGRAHIKEIIAMNEGLVVPHSLSSVKGDKEIANELRKKFFDVLTPVCELLAEAETYGFEVGFGFGKNAFGSTVIQNINLMKKY